MITLLLSLLILLVIFAIIWYIAGMIPVPPQFRWIVNVVLALIFLIAIIELFTGGFTILGTHVRI